jgi:hypothetical protein
VIFLSVSFETFKVFVLGTFLALVSLVTSPSEMAAHYYPTTLANPRRRTGSHRRSFQCGAICP